MALVKISGWQSRKHLCSSRSFRSQEPHVQAHRQTRPLEKTQENWNLNLLSTVRARYPNARIRTPFKIGMFFRSDFEWFHFQMVCSSTYWNGPFYNRTRTYWLYFRPSVVGNIHLIKLKKTICSKQCVRLLEVWGTASMSDTLTKHSKWPLA